VVLTFLLYASAHFTFAAVQLSGDAQVVTFLLQLLILHAKMFATH